AASPHTHLPSFPTRRSSDLPRLLLPVLKPLYDRAIPLSWLVIRVACGWNLTVHGWGKVSRGPSAFINVFVETGFDPALPWIWARSEEHTSELQSRSDLVCRL